MHVTCSLLSKSFRSPSATEFISLACPRETEPKRSRTRLPSREARVRARLRRVRGSEPGFSTVHPCTDENARTSCTRPLCGLIVSAPPLPRGPEDRRKLRLRCSLIPWERRVAEESGGERRVCLRPWMAEFAPADGFRATQGTSTALSSMRALRVSFLFVTFSLDKQREVTRWPEGTVKDLASGQNQHPAMVAAP